jgi:AcrR family transcriptional regulator
MLIIETAGVSRNTFYYHFASRADLIIYVFDQGLAACLGQRPDSGRPSPLDLGGYLFAERTLYYKLIRQSAERDKLANHIQGILFDYLKEIFDSLYDERNYPAREIELLIESLAYYAYFQVVSKVLRTDFEKRDYPIGGTGGKYQRLFYHLLPFLVDYYWDGQTAAAGGEPLEPSVEASGQELWAGSLRADGLENRVRDPLGARPGQHRLRLGSR